MKRLLICFAGMWALGVLMHPARAQVGVGTGDVGQQARRGMEMAMMDLENQALGITQEAMEESIGQEELEAFMSGVVVRLVLFPDGRFTSYSMLGGELVSFTVGKQEFSMGEEWSLDENEWVERSGEFKIPKKAQKVSLTVGSGGRQVTARCFNQYARGETPMTFYVGPLDGYFCMGLIEEGGS